MAGDRKWYPPASHPDPAHRDLYAAAEPPAGPAPAAAAPVTAPPTAPADPAGGPRRGRVAWLVALGVVVVALLVGIVGVVELGRGPASSAPATAVSLEAVGSVGDDPFATAMTVHEVAAFPTAVARVLGSQPPPAPSAAGPAVLMGTLPGLYGGTQQQAACDARQQETFLAQSADKARAWAGVEGIDPSGITAFIDGLVPVVLTRDTLVTNHGFRDGRATSLQSVLQAGTAVMIDSTGLPRIKCSCGNPLLAPAPATGTLAPQGVAWPGFDPAHVTVVTPGPAATTIQIIDLDRGQLVPTPIGATAAPGSPASPGAPRATTTTTAAPSAGSTAGDTTVAIELGNPVSGGQDEELLVHHGPLDQGAWDVAYRTTDEIDAIAYGNGAFLALVVSSCRGASSCAPSTKVLRADASGASWTTVATVGKRLSALAFGDGRWLAPFSAGDPETDPSVNAYESTDGTTWTVRPLVGADGFFEGFSSLAYGGGRWVAVRPAHEGGSPSTLFTSTDGTNWSRTGGGGPGDGSIGYGPPGWLETGHHMDATTGAVSGSVQRSTDGASWSVSPTAPTTAGVGPPVFRDGHWYAASQPSFGAAAPSATTIDLLRSDDGVAWTTAGSIPVPAGASVGQLATASP
jgi:hypothetical protein